MTDIGKVLLAVRPYNDGKQTEGFLIRILILQPLLQSKYVRLGIYSQPVGLGFDNSGFQPCISSPYSFDAVSISIMAFLQLQVT